MKTASFKGYKPTKLTYTFFGLIIILFLAFLDRGWIRSTVVPSFFDIRYNAQVQSAFDTASSQLQTSKTLGLHASNKSHASCNLDTASQFSIRVSCTASEFGDRHIEDAADLIAFNQQVITFHQRIHADGWQGGQQTKLSAPTQESLTINSSNVYWLSYGKKINGIPCLFQFGVEPSEQGGGYVSSDLICSRP